MLLLGERVMHWMRCCEDILHATPRSLHALPPRRKSMAQLMRDRTRQPAMPVLHVLPSRCDLGAGLLTLCSVQATKHRKYGLISKHCRGIREAEQADETRRRMILLGKTHSPHYAFAFEWTGERKRNASGTTRPIWRLFCRDGCRACSNRYSLDSSLTNSQLTKDLRFRSSAQAWCNEDKAGEGMRWARLPPFLSSAPSLCFYSQL
jgi:hypothetical protein